MTRRKHTPGEWHTSNDAVPEGHTQITVYSEATGDRVATVFERPENADLVAAAPDLWMAVKCALAEVESHRPMTAGTMFKLQDALAKAEGNA